MPLTLADIDRRLAEIADKAGDVEVTHYMEDVLWEDVLRAIAEGAPNPVDLASKALQSRPLVPDRWYA